MRRTVVSDWQIVFNCRQIRGIQHKMMKLTTSQIQRLSEKILNQWKSQNLITFKIDEKIVLKTIIDSITNEFLREEMLDKDVHALMDQMEREHEGQFQRHRMFPMLKQKLAKERKFIL